MTLENRCCSIIQVAISLLLLLIITQFFQNSDEQIVERLPLGSTLQPNQTLVSRNGCFALGFFSLGRDRNYLGVSYAGIPTITRIWMANRNNPARDGASLRFSMDGNLVVSNPDQTTVWMSDTSGRNISSMALMDESGNLILTHNTGRVIWQSFDHLTDTYMPGMKFYLGTSFTSSKSAIDPAEGRFSFRMLQTTSESVAMWNATTTYWNSGVWNGQIFADIADMSFNWRFMQNFSFLNDSGGRYFIWTEKHKTLMHFTLEYDGIFRYRIWDSSNAKWIIIGSQPRDPCQVDHLCGQNGICNSDSTPFCNCPQGFKPAEPVGWSAGDWSLGCVANFTFDCSCKTFFLLQNTYYDQGSGARSARSYSGLDQAWCQSSCTSDCACLGYYFDGGSINCSLQYGPFFNGKTSPEIGQNFFLRVNSSEQFPNDQLLLLNDAKRKERTTRNIGLGVAFGGALILMMTFLVWKILWRKRIAEKQSSDYMSGILRKFSYKELQTATSNFKEELGAGGFGSVYKGCLPDQTMVAVKKLHNMNQGDKDFRREVSTLGMIQHVNLVRLRGFCAADMHRLLVYDYMPNGDLSKLLFRKPGAQEHTVKLDWDTRFAIVLGTARGILYLHEECTSCIIHCDIKPSNILLDTNFCAKVSDFGLAKLMGREFSRVNTTMRGTRGYLAPEWLCSLPVTAKADVYSYGMTLFEIISGRKNMDANCSLDTWFFPLWACQKARLGEFSSLADIKPCGNFDEQQLKQVVLVALWCIQDEEMNRPSMARVVQMLEGTLQIADPPFPNSLKLMQIESTTAVS
ncbi:hypothetical protein O6H91_03G007000 [Diphasiastrum complanatum]|uniref:Uncharacterized protein n=1 Tax=Diphasiastrum complanatum TaxID=34168 RepID=A0ACC2E375_DIPCM|nr:hypothetical protein O6H91_Y533700 [Diphasiastrum complanatum]KAJ7560943.1 hypothetical protein O6H91_03G007000 [Diphasiastrum complanatum]